MITLKNRFSLYQIEKFLIAHPSDKYCVQYAQSVTEVRHIKEVYVRQRSS